MVRMTSVLALAFGFLSLSVMGFAQDEKKAKGKGFQRDPGEVFKQMDADGDGKVTLKEFKEAQNKQAEKMAEKGFTKIKEVYKEKPDLLDKMFAAYDKDKKGFVTLEQFKEGGEKARELMKELFKKKDN